jgi:hypothetical protein
VVTGPGPDSRQAGNDEPVFERSGPDGDSMRCQVCGAVDEVVQHEVPSMAGYGEDTSIRCTRCGSHETTDPIFGWQPQPAVWPRMPGQEQAQPMTDDDYTGGEDITTPAPRRTAEGGDAVNAEHADTRGPAKSPCGTCPYRRDVPSGVWDASEYAKLPPYDAPTALQPAGLFLCHQGDRRVCAGWAACHDTDELLALRLASATGGMSPDEVVATRNYVSPVPLFRSGREAANHGMANIDHPGPRARRATDRLRVKVNLRGLHRAVDTLPVPESPVDGDCLTWAPATARRLNERGHAAEVTDVAGWVNRPAPILVFVHRTVLVPTPHGPDAGHVVEVTARHFDPTLPARWLSGWQEYLTTLAHVTGVDYVTRWPKPRA